MRRINVFGHVIEIRGGCSRHSVEELVAGVVKRAEEKKILIEFLLGESRQKNRRIEELKDRSCNSAQREIDNALREGFDKGPVVDFIVGRLKSSRIAGGFSLYHDLVFQLIERDYPPMRRILQALREERIQETDIPERFPSMMKKAEVLLMGRLRSDIGVEEYRQYLEDKALLAGVRRLARDMFAAVNSGLEKKEVLSFMSLIYELRKLAIGFTNEPLVNKRLLQVFLGRELLPLIHIKCLRFAYPFGTGVKIIDHTGDDQIVTKSGLPYVFPSEEDYFQRINAFLRIFEEYGVEINPVILINDQDIDDHFSKGTLELTEEDFRRLHLVAVEYRNGVRTKFDGAVYLLREYLLSCGIYDEFSNKRDGLLMALRRGKSYYPEGYVESRVDYRTKFYGDVFAEAIGREEARVRVYRELATMGALSVLRENGREPILVQKEMGADENFIGGYRSSALPVIFISL